MRTHTSIIFPFKLSTEISLVIPSMYSLIRSVFIYKEVEEIR